jgi:hypothetical protein
MPSSAPQSTALSPTPSVGGRVGRTLFFLLVVGGLAGMLCCGGVSVVTVMLLGGVDRASQRISQVIDEKLKPMTLPGWENDWVMQEELTRPYTIALDAVTSNPDVIERLGDPVEQASEDIKRDYKQDLVGLFRRDGSGPLKDKETIMFRVKGPTGTGVVTVVAERSAIGNHMAPAEIKVATGDGPDIDIPPPKPQTQLSK